MIDPQATLQVGMDRLADVVGNYGQGKVDLARMLLVNALQEKARRNAEQAEKDRQLAVQEAISKDQGVRQEAQNKWYTTREMMQNRAAEVRQTEGNIAQRVRDADKSIKESERWLAEKYMQIPPFVGSRNNFEDLEAHADKLAALVNTRTKDIIEAEINSALGAQSQLQNVAASRKSAAAANALQSITGRLGEDEKARLNIAIRTMGLPAALKQAGLDVEYAQTVDALMADKSIQDMGRVQEEDALRTLMRISPVARQEAENRKPAAVEDPFLKALRERGGALGGASAVKDSLTTVAPAPAQDSVVMFPAPTPEEVAAAKARLALGLSPTPERVIQAERSVRLNPQMDDMARRGWGRWGFQPPSDSSSSWLQSLKDMFSNDAAPLYAPDPGPEELRQALGLP